MSRARLLGPLGCLLLGLTLGCAKKPDHADAKRVLTVVRALAEPGIDAKTALRMRYRGCAELPGCAAGCADALAFCSTPDSDEAQRGAVLAKCMSGVDKAAADTWFRRYFDRFVATSRPLLTDAEQAELDAALAAAK